MQTEAMRRRKADRKRAKGAWRRFAYAIAQAAKAKDPSGRVLGYVPHFIDGPAIAAVRAGQCLKIDPAWVMK